MGKLDNKIAIITGAGRGIGRGIAEKLATEGATVVVTDIDEQAAQTAAKELGGGAVGLRVDVTSKDSVAEMVGTVNEKFGRIDVLINNAGWDKVGPFVVIDAPGKSLGEVVLHWPDRRILLVGDAVVGDPPGKCKLLPDKVVDDPPRLRDSARQLLALDFDILLVGDGVPILAGAKERLRELVDTF